MKYQTSSSPNRALASVCLMVLMATLDMSIVMVSLPTLVTDLHTDFATVQWVIIIYTLILTCLMLSISRLGDMFGKKKIFAWGLVTFTCGSLLCGLASGIEMLLFSRAFQAIGATMSQALGLAIVTEIVPPQKRGQAIGIIGGTVSVGLAAGPSIGGLIISLLGWRAVFLVNVPLGIAAWFMFQRSVPDLPPLAKTRKFDFAGAVLLFAGLGCYCLAMTWGQNSGFSDPRVIALISSALVMGALFLFTELKTADPMLNMKLFKNPLFSINLLMGLLTFIFMATGFMLPFFFQFAQNMAPHQVGLMMMVVPLGMGLSSPLAGAMADRFGPRGISFFGLLLMAGGCFAMISYTENSGFASYIFRSLPIGLGAGFFQAPNNTAIMGSVPKEHLGIASGLINYSRVLGQTTGIPIMTSIFTAIVFSSASPLRHGTDFSLATPRDLASGISGIYQVSGPAILGIAGLAIVCILMARKTKTSHFGQ